MILKLIVSALVAGLSVGIAMMAISIFFGAILADLYLSFQRKFARI